MDISQYKVGLVEDIQLNGKLRICRVNIGQEDLITVVTSATNVRQGSRLAVATVGCTFLDEGTVQTVRKQNVGGTNSEGIFCDSYMLSWSGGAKGVAAQIPDEFDVGTAPPSQKPRRKDETETTDSIQEPTSTVVGLFEKKLTKEEKKKVAEERRNSRKARKNSEKEADAENESNDNQED